MTHARLARSTTRPQQTAGRVASKLERERLELASPIDGQHQEECDARIESDKLPTEAELALEAKEAELSTRKGRAASMPTRSTMASWYAGVIRVFVLEQWLAQVWHRAGSIDMRHHKRKTRARRVVL